MLTSIINTINSITPTEKIFCLGSNYQCHTAHNIFGTNAAQPMLLQGYQLLILLSDHERRQEDELLNTIENACRQLAPCVSVIIPMKVFNQWMMQGHLLAHRVFHSDCLVYDAGITPFMPPGNYVVEDLYKKIEKDYADWTQRASDFLRGALFYKDQQAYSLAAFHLHQTVEMTLMAIVRVTTGYRAGTHNIERLQKYAVNFCSVELNVFPCNNEKERKLFKLLSKAYIHSRYKNDFEITSAVLDTLCTRVKHLLQACEAFRQELDESRQQSGLLLPAGTAARVGI